MKTTLQNLAVISSLLLFASCNQEEGFSKIEAVKLDAPIEVINSACKQGDACDKTPQVSKPGVVTILLALGDIAQEKLVITEESALLIAQNAVKFASHISNPKILVVKDYFHSGESDGDTEFIAEKLLANYETKILFESSQGLSASDFVGYDVIWFNNPGHAMGNSKSLDALKAFAGGVILSGDDLSQGRGFETKSLTGLKYVDNGTSVSCNNRSYNYDNNSGSAYQVKLDEKFLPGVDASVLNFEYGNDIDNTVLVEAGSKYEVLAYANGAAGTCDIQRPVIVRYVK